ncbi:uncharacterized protein BDZ99DRAFT_460949 [Mytilinidion resinicola]|uniref:Uncharacterized protein n=1 Tax=Mytilinidion resinicola TaxID=574789 RepID=A0A6A6YUX6_9PEZI|nr:uncharacterized protein BDZ99DRAFT_460949 [Mytilinidion resinicola]KAF2812183.1 hypothetical protein BDZ99DRAFT_460949 [Mytilinidion resinicola]
MFEFTSTRLYSGSGSFPRSCKIDIESPENIGWLKGRGAALSKIPSMHIKLAMQLPPKPNGPLPARLRLRQS